MVFVRKSNRLTPCVFVKPFGEPFQLGKPPSNVVILEVFYPHDLEAIVIGRSNGVGAIPGNLFGPFPSVLLQPLLYIRLVICVFVDQTPKTERYEVRIGDMQVVGVGAVVFMEKVERVIAEGFVDVGIRIKPHEICYASQLVEKLRSEESVLLMIVCTARKVRFRR